MALPEKRKSLRVHLNKQLRVYLRSVGSILKYEFITEDLAFAGMGVISHKKKRYPFTTSTILDVWVQLDDEEQTVIFFNAKVVRAQVLEDGDTSLGLRIAQIEKADEERFLAYFEKCSKDSKFIITHKAS